MGYQTTPKIPVIDLSNENLKPGTSSWHSTAKDVGHALEEYSCFLAVFKVPSCEPFFDSLKDLFDLPFETKVQNSSDVPYFGYIGKQPQSPLYESLGINDGPSLHEVQSFTKRMWASGNDHFRDLMHEYATDVSTLDKMVTKMLFESYGLEKAGDSYLKSTIHNVRMNKYRAPKENETNVGVFAHTDLGFIGINQQSHVNGLEVRLKDGTWVPVDFPPSSFIILAGDGMMAWSNGKIRHCLHRVIMPGKERYSTGVFSYHTGIVQIPDVFIDESHPPQFKSFDHLGLLRFRFANPMIPEEERIKIYCGV